MNKINDRGNMKWTAMMLPEHVEMLNELNKQQEYKDKPIVDDQQVELIAFKLMEATDENKKAWIKYFKNHDFHEVVGYVEPIFSFDNYFNCVDDEEVVRIHYDWLVDVEIV
ncbi:YolD-like family protein [Oceanobacillus oncorhynchi]|uniref:YolD-like family protein n=1 Tax=Oceanobacillus oncorhynchi TaxID=545501 RepID=UPI0034D4D668